MKSHGGGIRIEWPRLEVGAAVIGVAIRNQIVLGAVKRGRFADLLKSFLPLSEARPVLQFYPKDPRQWRGPIKVLDDIGAVSLAVFRVGDEVFELSRSIRVKKRAGC